MSASPPGRLTVQDKVSWKLKQTRVLTPCGQPLVSYRQRQSTARQTRATIDHCKPWTECNPIFQQGDAVRQAKPHALTPGMQTVWSHAIFYLKHERGTSARLRSRVILVSEELFAEMTTPYKMLTCREIFECQHWNVHNCWSDGDGSVPSWSSRGIEDLALLQFITIFFCCNDFSSFVITEVSEFTSVC